jgi:hypothetical protein
MGGALLSFSLMAVAVRELLRTFGNFEILFLRSLVSLVLMPAILPRFGARRVAAKKTLSYDVRLPPAPERCRP